MLFGVTTMASFHKPILEALEMIKNSGFDCAEIWADHAWDAKKGASMEDLKATLHQYEPSGSFALDSRLRLWAHLPPGDELSYKQKEKYLPLA